MVVVFVGLSVRCYYRLNRGIWCSVCPEHSLSAVAPSLPIIQPNLHKTINKVAQVCRQTLNKLLRNLMLEVSTYTDLFGQFRLLREPPTQIYLIGQFHLMWELTTQRYINSFILRKTINLLNRVFHILCHGCCSCPLYNLCYININFATPPPLMKHSLCLFDIRFTNRSQVSCLNCKESLWKVIISNSLYTEIQT
jgi:hypothetical protein